MNKHKLMLCKEDLIVKIKKICLFNTRTSTKSTYGYHHDLVIQKKIKYPSDRCRPVVVWARPHNFVNGSWKVNAGETISHRDRASTFGTKHVVFEIFNKNI